VGGERKELSLGGKKHLKLCKRFVEEESRGTGNTPGLRGVKIHGNFRMKKTYGDQNSIGIYKCKQNLRREIT